MSGNDHYDDKAVKPVRERRAPCVPVQFEKVHQTAIERPFSGKYRDHWSDGNDGGIGYHAPRFKSDPPVAAGPATSSRSFRR